MEKKLRKDFLIAQFHFSKLKQQEMKNIMFKEGIECLEYMTWGL